MGRFEIKAGRVIEMLNALLEARENPQTILAVDDYPRWMNGDLVAVRTFRAIIECAPHGMYRQEHQGVIGILAAMVARCERDPSTLDDPQLVEALKGLAEDCFLELTEVEP